MEAADGQITGAHPSCTRNKQGAARARKSSRALQQQRCHSKQSLASACPPHLIAFAPPARAVPPPPYPPTAPSRPARQQLRPQLDAPSHECLKPLRTASLRSSASASLAARSAAVGSGVGSRTRLTPVSCSVSAALIAAAAGRVEDAAALGRTCRLANADAGLLRASTAGAHGGQRARTRVTARWARHARRGAAARRQAQAGAGRGKGVPGGGGGARGSCARSREDGSRRGLTHVLGTLRCALSNCSRIKSVAPGVALATPGNVHPATREAMCCAPRAPLHTATSSIAPWKACVWSACSPM